MEQIDELTFRAKFDSYSTSEDVMKDANCDGKIYIVTGATAGQINHYL